ncbi:MAG: DUF4279 domain-containing protein [Acidobacteriota bacterium]|nr:DUF4279 domain-containing protein [Acidobacteriota bacterium]
MLQEDSSPLISTSFTIEDPDLDPDHCTCEIGLEPTEAGRKGERLRPSSKVRLVTSVWTIALDKQPSWEIDEGLSQLMDHLWPKRKAIIDLLKRTRWSAGFSTSVIIQEDRPLYILGPETLRRLAYFGITYSLDIFDYSE